MKSIHSKARIIVFGLFRKDPVETLKREYADKRIRARDLQRNGDIIGYANMSAAADEVLKQLEAVESKQSDAST